MPAAKQERRRRWPKRLLISAASMAVSLVGCFVVFEYVVIPYLDSDVDTYKEAVFDPELGWRLEPGLYSVKPPQSLATHELRINELGLRGREFGPTSESTPARVIVLGDSFTFGKVVDGTALFTTQLESRLNAGRSGAPYEVINAGVPGYGNAQQLLLLRRLASAGVTGQVYVLCLFTNDILDNLCLDYGTLDDRPNQPGYALDPQGRLELVHPPEKREVPAHALQEGGGGPRFRSIGLLKARLESFAQSRPAMVRLAGFLGVEVDLARMPGVIHAWYDDEILERGLGLMQALIGAIKTEVEGLDGELLVCLIPSPIQVYAETYGPLVERKFPEAVAVKQFIADPGRPHTLVAEMCRELQLPFLDLFEVFRAARTRSLYVPREGHFNEAGHALTAACLEALLQTETPEFLGG